MKPFRDIPFKISYRKRQDSIADNFYIPCMTNAKSYDRAVAYFKSSIYAIAWKALSAFLKNGGKMRIICSPALHPTDVAAIESGYEQRTFLTYSTDLKYEIEKLLDCPILSDATKILGAMIANGRLDLKIALVEDRNSCIDLERLYHSKIGLFYDDYGNCVSFEGSMNETWNGLANDGNIESIDVAVSWEAERDTERTRDRQRYFEDLWNDNSPGIKIMPFPNVAKEILVRAAASNWEELIETLSNKLEGPKRKSPSEKTILPHQELALSHWEANGRRGIFEHATGSGKTFTAICAINNALSRDEKPLIIVPSQLLLQQWFNELKATFESIGLEILCCGAGNVKWRTDSLLTTWTRPSKKKRCVVATCATASTSEFGSRIISGQHIFMVADEVHRLGSDENQKIFEIDSGPRLGLSATPRRAGDAKGTQAIFDYFGPIIDPPYTLQDAINDGRLTPYSYRAHAIRLTDEEHDRWLELTTKISRLAGQNKSNPNITSEQRLKFALIERSRVIKSASNKVPFAVEILNAQYRDGDRWIVYCDSVVQLQSLMVELKRAGLPVNEYHSSMTGDPVLTLRYFEDYGGIIVSIRCLDEGIDIPSVSHALILASSSNPREFIQRRGRVLRRSVGKRIAYIHDVIVIPRIVDDQVEGASILMGELSRALEFGKSAINPLAINDLEMIATQFNIDITKFSGEGVEDEQPE